MQLCVRLHRVAAEKARQERGRVQQHVLRIAVDDLAENLTPMRGLRPTDERKRNREKSIAHFTLALLHRLDDEALALREEEEGIRGTFAEADLARSLQCRRVFVLRNFVDLPQGAERIGSERHKLECSRRPAIDELSFL